jgi:hypothetical protein
MGRRSSIVLVAPYHVPNGGNERGGDKDGGGVVDVGGVDGDRGWHAEERQSQQGPGDSNDVADNTNGAEVKLALADLLPAREEADGDGNGVGGGQADDTNTGKGVEGSSGTKVDEAEEDLDHHAEHHGVDGHIELVVDLDPEARAGDGAVAGKGPGGARGGGGASDAADDGEDDERHEQAKGTAGGANGGLDDDGDGLGGRQELGDFGEDEDEGDEEEEAGKGVDEDGHDHGLGDLGGGLADLFAHGDDHASGRGGVAGMQQTDHKGPAIGPARRSLKVGKDVFGIASAVLGNGEDADHDGNDTSKGPKDGGSIENGEPAVAEGRDGIAEKSDAEEDKEHLVGLGLEDGDAGAGLEDVDAANEEQGGAKIDGEGDGDVADDVAPSADTRRCDASWGARA